MLHLKGEYKTENASKYLQQLCKHFGHKITVEFDETAGRIEFAFSEAKLSADDQALHVDFAELPEDSAERARHVIDSHLKRFAFREEFEAMEWSEVA